MRRLFILSAVILSGVIVFIYFPSLRVGFFAQDYDFLEPVVRLSLDQYLVTTSIPASRSCGTDRYRACKSSWNMFSSARIRSGITGSISSSMW